MAATLQLRITDLADVAVARRRVRDALLDACDADQVGAAVLVVNELVTNGLMHGGGACRLRLELAPPVVRVAVADFDPTLPRRGGDAYDHGIAIVEALTTRWSTRPTDPPFAKEVVAEVPCGR